MATQSKTRIMAGSIATAANAPPNCARNRGCATEFASICSIVRTGGAGGMRGSGDEGIAARLTKHADSAVE